MRRTWWLGWLCVVLVGCSQRVSAHPISGTRFDAPIPLSFLFGGAGVTVAVTAAWLGVTERPPAMFEHRWILTTISPASARTLRILARVGFLGVVVGTLVHGLVGPQVRAENAATVFVWPLWLNGVGLLAILAGSPWRILSPWRTLYVFLTWVEGDEIALLDAYPQWIGTWPALFGFVFGVGIIENLTVLPRSPRLTVGLVLGYTVVMLIGGVVFGGSWFRHADTLAVLYRVFGRAAPFQFTLTDNDGYLIMARPPWRACTSPVRSIGMVVFVIATVYTISFDGFTSTPEFQTILFSTRMLGVGPAVKVGLYLVGLAGFIVSFLLISWLTETLGTETWTGWMQAAQAFAPTVIPITVAYEVAHNYPYVIRNLGQLLTITTDLLSVAGGPSITLLGWLSLPLFWGSQVVLIIAGHIVAVVAAHLVVVHRYDSLNTARRGHLPLVLLMVGYTILSLWIISRPVVAS
jgi:hypothetical protein